MTKKTRKNVEKLADQCKKCLKKLKFYETFLKTRFRNEKYDHIDVYCEKCYPKTKIFSN